MLGKFAEFQDILIADWQYDELETPLTGSQCNFLRSGVVLENLVCLVTILARDLNSGINQLAFKNLHFYVHTALRLCIYRALRY